MAKRRNRRNVVHTQNNNSKAQTQTSMQESWFKRNKKKILTAGALLVTGISCFVAGRATAPKDDLPWQPLPEETTDEEE